MCVGFNDQPRSSVTFQEFFMLTKIISQWFYSNPDDFFNSNFEFQVRILTDAVDDITTIDDFLAVSENHILDDVNNCVGAVQVIFCFHFLCLLTKIPWIYDFFWHTSILFINYKLKGWNICSLLNCSQHGWIFDESNVWCS